MQQYLGKIGDTVYLNESFRKGTIRSVGLQHYNILWEDDQTTQDVTPRSLYNQEGYDELLVKRKESARIAGLSLRSVDCLPGTVVYYIKDQETPFPRGKIAGIVSKHSTAGEVVIVEWDTGKLEKVELKVLFNEANGKAEEENRLAEEKRLEEEFEATRLIIAAKFKEAARAVNEAARIADAHGIDIQEDLYDEADCLEDAMRDAGWRTSSWNC